MSFSVEVDEAATMGLMQKQEHRTRNVIERSALPAVSYITLHKMAQKELKTLQKGVCRTRCILLMTMQAAGC